MIPYFGALCVIAADKAAIIENSLLNLKYLWQSFDYVDIDKNHNGEGTDGA